MSYTKTVWRDGDVITAAKMNKIEDGIENSLSEKLQALYKTMVGNDWPYENNPTDAEVIDKIAKDANIGGGGSEPSLLVATAEYSNDDYCYYVTSHSFEEICEWFYSGPDTIILNLVGNDHNARFSGLTWYYMDSDYDPSGNDHTLYLGNGEVAAKPSYDREGYSDVVRTRSMVLYKEQTDAAGNPKLSDIGYSSWTEI